MRKDKNISNKIKILKLKAKLLYKIAKFKSQLLKQNLLNLLKMLILTDIKDVNNDFFVTESSFSQIFKKKKKSLK